jgi:hypothetical protein
MKQNIILLIIITLLIIFVYMNRNVQIYTNSYNRIEQFVDVERESFNAGDTKHQLCTNFNEQCVGKVNGECDDSGIVGCQKFKIKCENRCQNKKVDDNGKTVTNMDECIETCQQVKTDCCQRLNKIV